MSARQRHGFTLIELSIALVIIGLVAGGVLVGRDLIEAARMRQQISQIEKYNTAANTFRTKYNHLPGDIPPDQATSLGFVPRSGAYAQGDGNGFINGATDQLYFWPTVGGETLYFWDDLSTAGLIEFDIQGLIPVGGLTTSVANVGLYLPPARIGRGFVTVYGTGDPADGDPPENNYQLVEFLPRPSSALLDGRTYLLGGPLTPMQALAMDQKTDDALPTSGAISAMETEPVGPVPFPALNYSIKYAASFGLPLHPTATLCVVDGTPIVYNTAAPEQANRNTCSLRIRAGF